MQQEAIGAVPATPSTRAGTRAPAVPWLIGAILILVVAVIGLGAVLAAPMVTTSPTTGLIDRNIAAWNAFDEATIRDVYAEDAFIFASSESTPVAKGIDEVVSLARWGGFSIERLGPVIERSSLAWYPVHISTTYDVAGDIAVIVLELRDGRIAQHWVVWGTE